MKTQTIKVEGISKELLTERYHVAKVLGNPIRANFLSDLIDQCTELPDRQWQTLEEFKDSGFIGLCWLLDNDGDVFAHNYDGEYFINPYMPNYPIHNERIRSVMPIKTPEAPK